MRRFFRQTLIYKLERYFTVKLHESRFLFRNASSYFAGTDDGDLNFDFLSNFGPRFRKLADMYGEDPSDEEEDNYNIPASESWC